MKKIFKYLIILLFSESLNAQENLVQLHNLAGTWKFSIGINDNWASSKFDDTNWESIKVPSTWEDQGFYGYNGFAFYRKKILIPSEDKGRMLYLLLGYIDDVDEVYFNGRKIGSTGSFPPNYTSAYNAKRKYFIPEEYVIFGGTNTIAVKVYDSQQEGGIVGGTIGIFGGKVAAGLTINLQSGWKFKTGDDIARKDPAFNDSDWKEIFVPSNWEDQGYRDYDGFAWYRKSFVLKSLPENEKMVIMMGKIDDIDEVYINGKWIGSTGVFKPKVQVGDEEWKSFRGYYIPDGVLRPGEKNVIAVRVYDPWGNGGIYEGPIGLITHTKYVEYWRSIRNSRKN